MQETWVWSLGQEDPLEKELATHSSMLAWEIPWTEEPGGLQSVGSQRVRNDLATKLQQSANEIYSLNIWGFADGRLQLGLMQTVWGNLDTLYVYLHPYSPYSPLFPNVLQPVNTPITVWWRKELGGTNVTHHIHPHFHPIHDNCVHRTMHRFPETHKQVRAASCPLVTSPSSGETWSRTWFRGNPWDPGMPRGRLKHLRCPGHLSGVCGWTTGLE